MAWNKLGVVAGLVGWMCGAGVTSAQPPTIFSNRSTWAAAAGPVNTITFEGIAPAGSYATFDTSFGMQLQGVGFLGSRTVRTQGNYLRVVDAAYATGFNWGSGAVLHGPPEIVGPQGEGGPGSGLLATLYAGINWFGADVMSFAQYGSQIEVAVTLRDGVEHVFTVNTPPYPQRGFVGFVSTLQIISVRFVGKTGFPTLDNVSLGGPTAIGPPTLTATVAGSAVAFNWSPAPVSAPVTGYVLEAALTPGGPAAAVAALPSNVYVAPNVPNGTYYARVHGVFGGIHGPSSNEVTVIVGSCTSPPNAPTGLTGSAANGVVAIAWTPSSGCTPSGYLIRAGSGPGRSDIGMFPVGAVTSLSAAVPPRTYYLAALAQNGAGVSGPSNEIQITVGAGCSVPAAPTSVIANVADDFVTLMWHAPPGPVTRYLLEVGTGPGRTDVGVFPIVTTGLQVSGASGTYYFRLRAENACGVGPATEEHVLTAGA